MKKRYLLPALFLLLSLILTACSTEKKDMGKFPDNIESNIDILNSCYLEIFGADVDFNTEYIGAFESTKTEEETLNVDPDYIFLAEDEEKYSMYKPDPICASYYKVSQFKTNEDVRNNLRQYMSDNVIDMFFNDDFVEHNGELYLKRGSRGYGALKLDYTSLNLISEAEDTLQASIDLYLFDVIDDTLLLDFENKDGKWILSNITKNK